MRYLQQRREALGGYMPARSASAEPVPVPPLSGYGGFATAAEGKETDGLAIAGFVMSLLIPIVGLVLSAIALGRIKKRNSGGRGLATAGLIIGIVFTVVGILAPTGTVTDRLILTTIDSVWAMHGIEDPNAETHPPDDTHDHGEDHDHDHAKDTPKPGAEPAAAILDPRGGPAPDITAILVTYRNAMAAVRLPSAINRETALQAASPATETARLLSLFGAAFDGARLFAWLVALTGLASVFVILLAAATAREGDMALLRVMGASRSQAAGTVLLEGLIIAAIGAMLGLASAHALLADGHTIGKIALEGWPQR
jgi:hypothetical protein